MTRRSSTVAVAATPSDWPGWPSSAASGQSTPGGRSGSVLPTPPPRQRVRMFPRKRPPRNARAGGGRRRAGVAAAASAATPAACPRRPRRSQVQYMRLRRRAQPPASARCTAGVPVGWRQRQVATVADGRPTTPPVGAIVAAVPAAAAPPPPRCQRRKEGADRRPRRAAVARRGISEPATPPPGTHRAPFPPARGERPRRRGARRGDGGRERGGRRAGAADEGDPRAWRVRCGGCPLSALASLVGCGTGAATTCRRHRRVDEGGGQARQRRGGRVLQRV